MKAKEGFSLDDELITHNITFNTIIGFPKSNTHPKSDTHEFFDTDIRKDHSYIQIIEDDLSFPKEYQLPRTKIKDIKFAGNFYIVNAKILKGPMGTEYEGHIRTEYDFDFYTTVKIGDNTGDVLLTDFRSNSILEKYKVGDKIEVIAKAHHDIDSRHFELNVLPTSIIKVKQRSARSKNRESCW